MFDDTRTGAALLLGHFGTLGASVLLLCAWIGIGGAARRAMRVAGLGLPTQLLVDATLGMGVLAMAFLALGVAGALGRGGVLAATAVGAVMGARDFTRTARELRAAIRARLADRETRVAVALLVGVFALLVAGALGPPTDWDSLMYHLRVPAWFLEHGRIALPPDSFHAALVGAAHLATLPLLALGLFAAPAVIHVLVLLLVLAGTWELARAIRVVGRARWLAVAAMLGAPAVALGAITARVDVFLLLPLLAAHLLLLHAREQSDRRAVLVAAVAMGLAIAIKPIAAAYALLLIPLGLRASRDWRTALAAVAVATVIVLPWLAKTLWLAGAPLYPRGAPGWFEPWIAEIFGGRIPPEGFDRSVLRALRQSRAPFDLAAAFLSPGRIAIEWEGRHYALSPLFVLAPLAVFWWRTRVAAVEAAAIGIVLVTLVIAPFEGANLRYLLPAFPALAAASASVADRLAQRAAGRWRAAALVALGLVAIAPLGSALWSRFVGHTVLVRHAAGLASAREVWIHHPDPVARAYAKAIDAVHHVVPRDGRVLLLWEARALPLGRDALADVRVSNWSYLAQSPAPGRCLAGTGITHVLVNTGARDFYAGRGAGVAAFRLPDYERFRARCAGSVLTLDTGFELLTLRETPAPAGTSG